MYLDRLMESGQALDWEMCRVGVLPQDAIASMARLTYVRRGGGSPGTLLACVPIRCAATNA
jgi:hypothetical protein